MRRLAAIERGDHGLNDGRGAVVGAGVRPAFEVMGPINVPPGLDPGFIQVGGEMDGEFHAGKSLIEVQIDRRGVNRVAVENHQGVDLTRLHVIHQADDFFALDRWHGVDGLGVDDRFAYVAERLIDGDSRQMNSRRLLLARNDHALATVGLEVGRNHGKEFPRGPGKCRCSRTAGSQGGGEGGGEGGNFTGLERHAMLGLKAGGRRCALHGVEPIHGDAAICSGEFAASGVVRGQAEKARESDAGEEVSIERDDDIRVLQPVLRVTKFAEGGFGGCVGGVAVDRIPLHPLGVGIGLLRGLPLGCQRRGGHGIAEDVKSCAAACFFVGQQGAEGGKEGSELTRFAAREDALRAIGIIEVQQGTLGQGIRSAAIERVLGIAIYFDRPVGVALDQQRHRTGIERHGGSEVNGTAKNQVFGFLNVGVNLFVGLFGATRETGQGERSTHDLKEAATRCGVNPFGSLRRKLALQCFAEGRSIGQLIHAAPIGFAGLAGEPGSGGCERGRSVLGFVCHVCFALAHRWHVSQLLNSWGVRMWYCWVRYLPREIWSVSFT